MSPIFNLTIHRPDRLLGLFRGRLAVLDAILAGPTPTKRDAQEYEQIKCLLSQMERAMEERAYRVREPDGGESEPVRHVDNDALWVRAEGVQS